MEAPGQDEVGLQGVHLAGDNSLVLKQALPWIKRIHVAQLQILGATKDYVALTVAAGRLHCCLLHAGFKYWEFIQYILTSKLALKQTGFVQGTSARTSLTSGG